MKQPLTHLALEPYGARYTEWLADIEKSAFENDFSYKRLVPPGKKTPLIIRNGQVLDTVSRPIHAMRQIQQVLEMRGNDKGKLWFSDFFHPGLEALPYSRSRFQASAFLWAQSFDCYDFTAPMVSWMRPWEIMAFEVYTKVFVASSLLRDLI